VVLLLNEILFPDESKLRIDGIQIEATTVVIAICSTNQQESCPHCLCESQRIHSRYRRHPADLPLAGCTVCLDITVNRFFCDNDDCQCVTFAERMQKFVKPHARRTHRLQQNQLSVAFVAGGEAGARLLSGLGMPVSPDTLLRMMRNAKEPEVTTPRVLGVDDWAIRRGRLQRIAPRKGQSYGTILVDLENRRPVDLLPDRRATSLEAWLKAHPGVEIISRDRGKEYIKGATSGAPDAIQVADRWHLLKNLRETLERLLEGKPDCLKAAASSKAKEQSRKASEALAPRQQDNQPVTDDKTPEHEATATQEQQTHEQPAMEEIKLTPADKVQLQRDARRKKRYTIVKKLKQEGHSIREISRRTQISRQTVTKYVKAEECPQYPKGVKRKSKLQPYKNYIRQRLQEGCHKATRIFSELRQKGFLGSYATVARFLRTEKTQMPGGPKPPKEVVPYSPRRAAWLLVKHEKDMTDDERNALEGIIQTDSSVAYAHTLGQRFSAMIKEQDCEALRPWLKDVADSGIDTLKQFAKGIKQDLDAVTNALRLPWSQGQVEGQVNRLKLIKRQMYGRANFDLLRKKVLLTNDVLTEAPT
jgi:transposase